MSSPIQIRGATEADIAEMHRIRIAVRENQLADPGAVQLHHYRTMLRDSGRGWVAEMDNQMAGFAIADLTLPSIWALFVDPAFEGCGVGRRLHETMLDWLFAAGFERVRLSTEPATRAERFYRAAGWRYGGLHPNGEARYEMSREWWLMGSADGDDSLGVG
jgi:GNAT superfamily N-acetyltransferase